MTQQCCECGLQFSFVSQRFYCCSQLRPVCSICRRITCQQCTKKRTNEIVIPKCNKCYCKLYQNDLLLQYNCDNYYCPKCLSQVFQDAYTRVNVRKLYDLQSIDVFVKLHCGHEFPYEQLTAFFQHFCLACGSEYYSKSDYEMIDGVKLCSHCYRQYSQLYKDLFIRCSLCEKIIRNSSIASVLKNQDLAICQVCIKDAKINQKFIDKDWKNSQFKQNKNLFSQQGKQPIPQTKLNNFIDQQSTNQSTKSKITQPQIEKSLQSDKLSQPKKSTKKKLLSKPSITELKQKQENRVFKNDPSKLTSITTKFSNDFEDVDEETYESLGLSSDFKLKKYFSDQTFVESFPIDIIVSNSNNFAKCKKCNIQTLQRFAYNLSSIIREIEQSKASRIEQKLSTSDSFLSRSKVDSDWICRVCYFISAQRQKEIKNSSKSANIKTSLSNRSPKYEQVEPQIDYLKPGTLTRKQMRSPSPSPIDRQYSLTGSSVKMQQQLNLASFMQKTSNLAQEQKKKKLPQAKQSYQQSKYNPQKISQPSLKKILKCNMCQNIVKSLATTVQGPLCDDCFYRKNPHYYKKK